MVKPVMLNEGGDRRASRSVEFGKSPARVNQYNCGVLIDWEKKSPLMVLSADEAREISLTAKLVTGDLIEDYDYMVLAPEKGVSVKNKIASNADDTLRLSLVLTEDAPFKAGDEAELIIGLVQKKEGVTSLVAATQSLRFVCQ